MNSDSIAYMASIDDSRRVWGQYRHGFGCSFYIVNGDMVTELHLTIEGTEALRLVIEKLQSEILSIGYMKISTQAHSPNKKNPTVAKKAGNNRKTKRPSLAKKKKSK